MTRVPAPLSLEDFDRFNPPPEASTGPAPISIEELDAQQAEMPDVDWHEGDHPAAAEIWDNLLLFRKHGFEPSSRIAMRAVPEAKLGYQMMEDGAAIAAADRIVNGNYTMADPWIVAQRMWFDELDGDRDTIHKIGEGIIDSSGYMMSFAATGGVYRLAKGAVMKGLRKAAPRVMGKRALSGQARKRARNFMMRLAGTATGLSAQTLFNPHHIAARGMKNLRQNYKLDIDSEGALRFAMVEDPQGFAEAMGRGFVEELITIGAERSGALLALPPEVRRRIAQMAPVQKLTVARVGLMNRWLKKFPGRTPEMFQASVKKIGWNGVYAEMLEEQVERLGQTTAQKAGLAGGVQEQEQVTWRDALPTAEELFMEGMTIMGLSGIIKGYEVGVHQINRAEYEERVRKIEEHLERRLGGRVVEDGKPTPEIIEAEVVEPEEAEETQEAEEAKEAEPAAPVEEAEPTPTPQAPLPTQVTAEELAQPVEDVVPTKGTDVEGTIETVSDAATHVARTANFNIQRLTQIADKPSRRTFERELGLTIPSHAERQHIATAALSIARTQPDVPTQAQEFEVESAFKAIRKADPLAKVARAEPSGEQEQDAAEFIRHMGLTPVFYESVSPVRGISQRATGNVFVRSFQETPALWETVAHEIGHGVGIDMLEIPESEWRPAWNEYRSKLPGDAADKLYPDEHSHRREGVATLVQNFFQDPEVRKSMKKDRPVTYSHMNKAIFDSLRGFVPRNKELREVLADIRTPLQTKNLARSLGIPAKGKQSSLEAKIEGKLSELMGKRPFQSVEEISAMLNAHDPMLETGDRGEALDAFLERGRKTPVEPSVLAPPASQKRIDDKSGVAEGPGLFARMVDGTRRLALSFGRRSTAPDIPRRSEFGKDFFDSAKEGLRLSFQVVESGISKALDTVAKILGDLTPQQYTVLNQHVIAQQADFINRTTGAQIYELDGVKAPAFLQQTTAVVAKSPQVTAALKRRHDARVNLLQRAVDARLLPEAVLDNVDEYFHFMIMAHMNSDRLHGGGGTLKRRKRASQIPRTRGTGDTGPENDPNSELLEHEIKWMSEVQIELDKHELLMEFIKKPYDVSADVEVLRQAMQAQLGRDVDFEEAVATHFPNYRTWTPHPGKFFYKALALNEQVAEQLMKTGNADISPDDVTEAMVLGGVRDKMVIPKLLADQLDKMDKQQGNHPIDEVVRGIVKNWKVYTLFVNPKNIVGYQIRNLAGDSDVLFAYPSAYLKFIPAATALYDYYRHGKVTPELERAIELGVIDAGFTTTEIPKLKDQRLLLKYGRVNQSVMPVRVIKGYYRGLHGLSRYRESLNRYAIYLKSKEDIEAGKFNNYAATRRSIIDNLIDNHGADFAAARVSRDLLGDYGNRTVMGDWLRDHLVPFWAFQEINLARYPRIVMNSFSQGTAMSKAMALPRATGLVAGAALNARLILIYAATQAWNNWACPDEERELPLEDRVSPHICLGRNDDGSVRIFRNFGAMGDFLEWFGVVRMPKVFEQTREGQMELDEAVAEMSLLPVVRKAASQVGPFPKFILHQAFGESMFPDPLNTRSVPRSEAVPELLGLVDEWRAVNGWRTGDGRRLRPHWGQRFFWGVQHPGASALHETHDLVRQYKKVRKNQETHKWGAPSPTKNMRLAAISGDYHAFIDAREAYLKQKRDQGRSPKEITRDFIASVRGIDPLFGDLSRKDKALFRTTFLNERQRDRLRVAQDYSKDLASVMTNYWIWAAKGYSDPP